MTDRQDLINKFVELEKKKDEYKLFVEELSSTLELLHKELGTGSHFQDSNGTVYQLTIPDGKFVYFEKFGYERTKRPHEKSGSLSVKRAQELGYNLK